MLIFLLIVAILELIWIVGSILIVAYMFSPEGRKEAEKFIDVVTRGDRPVTRESGSAMLAVLWFPILILTLYYKIKSLFTGD